MFHEAAAAPAEVADSISARPPVVDAAGGQPQVVSGFREVRKTRVCLCESEKSLDIAAAKIVQGMTSIMVVGLGLPSTSTLLQGIRVSVKNILQNKTSDEEITAFACEDENLTLLVVELKKSTKMSGATPASFLGGDLPAYPLPTLACPPPPARPCAYPLAIPLSTTP